MSKKGIRIAARIVFGILALAALITCIYYIVEGSLSEVLSSMTLCLLSVSLGYIYGRNDPEPEEGIVPEAEKNSVRSHIGMDSVVVLGDGDWSLDGRAGGKSVYGSITTGNGEIICTTDDGRKIVLTGITNETFTLLDLSGDKVNCEIHATRK
ncbi:MAG: hypothetical protein LUC38_05255 [Oscillospiraceae bacterium]|nr:hypothetical protein [Ruminococcus sp.]MCD8345353.1 hypothetical protein [Oscillospiraceae bacterium]